MNNKELYNKIMESVSKEVKKTLNEESPLYMKDDDVILGNDLVSYVDIKKYIESRYYKIDNEYEIPSSLDNISNRKLDVLLAYNTGIVKIYGIQDKIGDIHINKDDWDRICAYVDEEGISTLKRMYRAKYKYQLIYIDFRTSEELKHTFFSDEY